MFLVRVAYERQQHKFDYRMELVARISLEARALLRALPLEKRALSNDKGRQLGLMTSNFFEAFKRILKGLEMFQSLH